VRELPRPQTHVDWQIERQIPYVPSPVVYDGTLFMVKNGGIVTSVDADTGKIVRSGRAEGTKNYYSSPVVGDGKIYLADQSGVVTVLAAEPKWSVLSSADFGEEIFATPALCDGRIYLRTAGHLYCIAADADSANDVSATGR
jgi:outer membrane protein assembly factor BamB